MTQDPSRNPNDPLAPLPRADGRPQLDPRGHHQLREQEDIYEASFTDERDASQFLRHALNWNQQDLRYSKDHGIRGQAVRTDAQILEEACEKLREDPYIDASDIDVSCENGVVYLTGEIGSRAQKQRAESLVELCRGVRDVRNRLRIND